jgi:putative SOS response-associated peptidase YedK
MGCLRKPKATNYSPRQEVEGQKSSMCNLYSVRTSRAALTRKFGLSDNRMAGIEPLPATFPGHMAPIIRQSADGERELVLRSWGFILLRDGYAPKRVTNTRDDKVDSKFWKDSFEKRRCLVPATAFCEPDEGKPARWHWFALNGEEERPLFAFPGIYRQWKGPIKKTGPNVDIEVFSFMTTLPNALTTTINHERSPVLLTEEQQFSTWLTGSAKEAFGLIRTSDPASMRIVQSGFDKEDLLAMA